MRPPDRQTDAATPPSDAAAPDAAPAVDAGEPRGPAPSWPPAEQTLSLPFRSAPLRAELTLAPNPSQLDLHFNVDTTASFGGEIANMQGELSRSIIPGLLARVADTRVGVSRFADFPVQPFGMPSVPGTQSRADVPYALLCPVTASLARVTNALREMNNPLDNGADIPEAGAEALYQIATGVGLELGRQTSIAPFDPAKAAANGGESDAVLGGVGFRATALRVVVHVTDAPSHTPDEYAALAIAPTHSLREAATALGALGVRVLAINSAASDDPEYSRVREELSALALATGAYAAPINGRCLTGVDASARPTYREQCPWVFDVAPDGSGLSDRIVDAVAGLLEDVEFSEVHAEAGSDPLGFIERIELAPVAQPAGVNAPATSDRLPLDEPDGRADSYLAVTKRHRLGFAVYLSNQRIAPSDGLQAYRVSVRLVGDGVMLEERVLAVRVDPTEQRADADDAGVSD
ncbi:MAG: hypothetical protein ABW321_12290 [Polyangiales bacterium]